MTFHSVPGRSLHGQAQCFDDLRAALDMMPVIDTHDHSTRLGPKYDDPVQVIVGEYMLTDLSSATSDEATRILLDSSISLEERWPALGYCFWERRIIESTAERSSRGVKSAQQA